MPRISRPGILSTLRRISLGIILFSLGLLSSAQPVSAQPGNMPGEQNQLYQGRRDQERRQQEAERDAARQFAEEQRWSRIEEARRQSGQQPSTKQPGLEPEDDDPEDEAGLPSHETDREGSPAKANSIKPLGIFLAFSLAGTLWLHWKRRRPIETIAVAAAAACLAWGWYWRERALASPSHDEPRSANRVERAGDPGPDDADTLAPIPPQRSLFLDGETSKNWLGGQGLQALEKLDGVQSLTLSHGNLTRVEMAAISRSTSLRSITITFCTIESGGLKELSRLPNLKAVRLGSPDRQADRYMTYKAGTLDLPAEEIAELANIPDLRSLILVMKTGNRQFNPVLKAVAGMPHLRELSLMTTDRVTAAGLSELARLPALRQLSLSHIRLSRNSLRAIARIGSLRTLELSLSGLPEAAFADLAGFDKLESLDLSGAISSAEWNAALGHLAKLPNLRSLRLDADRVNDAAVRALARFSRLESLSLPLVEASDDAMMELSRHATLRNLSLVFTPQSVKAVKAMQGFRAVKNWSLFSWFVNTPNIPDEAFTAFAGLTNVQSLTVDRQVTDAHLKEIARLKNLRELDLKYSSVTDRGLSVLKGLNLASLAVPDKARTPTGLKHFLDAVKPLDRLDLADWNANDLAVLAGYPGLRSLSIASKQLKPEDAKLLASLQELRVLSIPSSALTGMTLDAVLELGKLESLYLPHFDDTPKEFRDNPAVIWTPPVAPPGFADTLARLKRLRPDIRVVGH